MVGLGHEGCQLVRIKPCPLHVSVLLRRRARAAGTLSQSAVLCASDVCVVLESCWLPRILRASASAEPSKKKGNWGAGRAEGEFYVQTEEVAIFSGRALTLV